MNQKSSFIDKNDKLVSEIVKARDPVCRLKLTGCEHYTVDPMHVFSRGNMATRWKLYAIYGGCRNCHNYVDTHPDDKEIHFKLIMGEDVYNEAKKFSNSIAKYSLSDLKAINHSLKEKKKILALHRGI